MRKRATVRLARRRVWHMPVPKQRHTRSRRNMRRSHHALSATTFTACAHCRHLVVPHRMCPYCGYYAGREIVDVLAKLTRRERKKREKEEKRRQAETELAKQGVKTEE